MYIANGPRKIAVIGSGISGLSAAWLLAKSHNVTVYEAAGRLGGHTRTFHVDKVGPVDMGFIVYNEATYPNLVGLFRHLEVQTRASDMSFAVSLQDGRYEYAGTDLWGLLAQPINALRPRFWRMMTDLLRFYRQAPLDAAAVEREMISLGEYLAAGRYNRAFVEDHLLPMASAIWSTPMKDVAAYPAASFIRFCDNHGLLKLTDRPIWRTVVGGSSAYIDPLTEGYRDNIRLNAPVVGIRRTDSAVMVRDGSGAEERFDEVVIATHAPQALAMLEDPSNAETQLLGAIKTRDNRVVLHRDTRLMPKRKRAWASWNYIQTAAGEQCVTYWMNNLQGFHSDPPCLVTLNPPFEPEGVERVEHFAHPQFDVAAMNAQQALWSLQGTRRTWYCGAWFGSGFHEDGLQAGLAVAEQLGGKRRPWQVPNESSRIHHPPQVAS